MISCKCGNVHVDSVVGSINVSKIKNIETKNNVSKNVKDAKNENNSAFEKNHFAILEAEHQNWKVMS